MPAPRILLDECIDRRVRNGLRGFRVKTVPEMGWAGLKNGKLLARAASQFDVFVTVDRNISFQLDVMKFEIAVAVLQAKTNRLDDLLPVIPYLTRALPTLLPGKVYHFP